MNASQQPSTKTNDRIRDEMSDKIIETAEHLATTEGANTLTVRKILQTMDITNRVFYNRFHNIEEVLEIIYRNMVMKIRASVTPEQTDSAQDFFEHVIEVVTRSLIMSYENKMQFNQYVFENDSHSQSNYAWWHSEIKKLIDYAKEKKYIKDLDSDAMSYAIWCFCRGYNADAVGRNLPMEVAIENFRYSFGILLDGMRA
ncbi:MAG: TetR/AcrR family transcriptional regulator [Ruminococcaceae bacterium]|nr:TetR/AcrR family transcriptional regulator [Oscillospiraceae bacterium]